MSGHHTNTNDTLVSSAMLDHSVGGDSDYKARLGVQPQPLYQLTLRRV